MGRIIKKNAWIVENKKKIQRQVKKQKWDKEKSCEAHKYFPADRGTQEIAHKYLILINIWMKHFVYKILRKSSLRLSALQHEFDQNPNLKWFYIASTIPIIIGCNFLNIWTLILLVNL